MTPLGIVCWPLNTAARVVKKAGFHKAAHHAHRKATLSHGAHHAHRAAAAKTAATGAAKKAVIWKCVAIGLPLVGGGGIVAGGLPGWPAAAPVEQPGYSEFTPLYPELGTSGVASGTGLAVILPPGAGEFETVALVPPMTALPETLPALIPVAEIGGPPQTETESPHAVPEPSSMALLATAVAAMTAAIVATAGKCPPGLRGAQATPDMRVRQQQQCGEGEQ